MTKFYSFLSMLACRQRKNIYSYDFLPVYFAVPFVLLHSSEVASICSRFLFKETDSQHSAGRITVGQYVMKKIGAMVYDLSTLCSSLFHLEGLEVEKINMEV